jgi:hypothetical protein
MPSTTLFKYTVSPLVNFASSMGSVTLNKIDDEIFIEKDDSGFLDLNRERQIARQQEIHSLIHKDVMEASQRDTNVTQETNTLIPEGAKKELLYLTERFSETYSYGFKLGFKIGVSAGLAFLKYEAINLVLKKGLPKLVKLAGKLTGPFSVLVNAVVKVVEVIIIVYDKAREALKFIYMKIIAFGWFILGIFFMMSFKFLFAMLNVVMEFSIAALLVPFAIITYPFKGVLGIGDFRKGIEDRFISNCCYLFMICVISSFIYFIFSHFLQTPYEYKGDIRTLKSILDEVLYGGAITSTWGYISSFMLFFWNNLDIMFIMAGIGIIGMRLIEQTAQLTGVYLTPVSTTYENDFLNRFFTAGKKIFSGVKTEFVKVKKVYGDAKKKYEEAESVDNIEEVVEAYNVQSEINDIEREIQNRIEAADSEVQEVMREIVKDETSQGEGDDGEPLSNLSEEAQEAYISKAVDDIDSTSQDRFKEQVLNDERAKDFSPNQKSTVNNMISSGDINKSRTLYSSPEEMSSDQHFQDKVKNRYIENKIADASNNNSYHELEKEYKSSVNNSESPINKEVKDISKEVAKEDKEAVEKVFAEHKAKQMMKEDGFKDMVKDTSLGKNGRLDDEKWIEDKAVDIIRVARNKEGGKEYLSNEFSHEKKQKLQKEFKEIFELQNELKNLKSNKVLERQCKRLGVDEINNKVIIDEIYDAQGAILSNAKNKYKDRLELYGKENLPEEEKKKIKQIDLLIKSNERKVKKKKKASKKEEFSMYETEGDDLFSQENVDNEIAETEKLLKQLGLNNEYSLFKRQRRRADKKSKDGAEENETPDEHEEL